MKCRLDPWVLRAAATIAACATFVSPAADEPPAAGVEIRYQLPAAGPLPRTWLVTLAIVAKDNPDWIISQFLRGAARTVTADNQGRFADNWDGLDENLMPVPPGTYAVKGICAPAQKWQVDGEYHAITPRFVAGASSWLPSPEQWNVPEPFGGDPCGAPLGDVDVGPNGVAVFYYVYLENGTNNPLFDLKEIRGHDPISGRSGHRDRVPGFVRGYCVGYPKFRAGLVFAGPAERLWQLRLSAAPPEKTLP